jgi:hypothetical protein
MGMSFDSDANVGAGIDFSDPNSPLARFYLRLGDVAAVLLIAAVFVLLNFTKLWHTDIWGHLKHGEIWLQTGRFPDRDQLSYASDPNGGAVNYAWLSQVVLALVYRLGAWLGGTNPDQQLAGGADALRFLLSVLVAGRLTLLYLAFRRLAQSSVIALLGIGFVVGISLGNLGILRPQVFAEVLFAGLIYLLTRRELTWNSVLALAGLLTVWANCHASFLVGCLTIGALWLGRGVELVCGVTPGVTSAWDDQRLRRLTATLALALVGITFLNPEGWRIWSKTAAMADHPNVRAMDEWQSLFSSVAGGARVTYFICLAWVVMAWLSSRRRPTIETLTLLLAFALPPLFHQRAVIWLITVAAWISVTFLGMALAQRRPTWWSSVPSFRRTIVAGAIVVIALMWTIPVRHLIDQKPLELTKSLSDGTPYELALRVAGVGSADDAKWTQALQSYPSGRFQGAIFTSETLGDFFLWPLQPPAPVFIYSHVHLFSPDHWKRYVTIRDAMSNWKAELDRSGVNLVVLYAEPRLNLARELAKDKDWTVLVDETEQKKAKLDPRCRLFAAIRRQPLLPNSGDVKK